MQYFLCNPAILVSAESIIKAWFSHLRFLSCCFLLLAGLLLAAHPVQAEVKPGDILVTDFLGGTDGRGALVVVDATTGQRTILSDFGDAAQSDLGLSLRSVAVFRCDSHNRGKSASGDSGNSNPHRCSDGETLQIFVTHGDILFKIDPDTGHRTLISNSRQGDIQGFFDYGLAVDAKGQVIANLNRLAPPNFEINSAAC